MSDFSNQKIVKAKKMHRCCECYGAILPGDQYERTFVVYEGDSSAFKTCLPCKEAQNWLTNDTDWPDDIDGDGHCYFFTCLKEHLLEQARHGSKQYAFKAYRYIVGMDNRRKAYKGSKDV